jgi:hypothetical protein
LFVFSWPSSFDDWLLSHVDNFRDNVSEHSLLTMTSTQIVVSPNQFEQFEQMNCVQPTLSSIRLRFLFFRRFNELFATLLPLIDLRRIHEINSIAGLVAQCKKYIFQSVKIGFVDSILDFTSEDSKPPAISINRLALAQLKQSGIPLDILKHSHFGASFRQLSSIEPNRLKPIRPHGTEPFLAFEVNFQQEHVVGEGGPYRQVTIQSNVVSIVVTFILIVRIFVMFLVFF